MLYTESDLEAAMDKIETINFHEEKEVSRGYMFNFKRYYLIQVSGVKFWCYNAGHVLGAAMFMLEIDGVKILYTGDFSREEDRHLPSAEIPSMTPDVLIVESTYGTKQHEKREVREARFTGTVTDIVTRGGRCLIPVFALGRAQELLLILDEFWSAHPELADIPIYYASSLAKKCMSVYQTFINSMNERIRKQIAVNNPFVFKHISNLKGIDHFDDVGPCVVLASPGMMQSGLSRELFETWCTDKRNGCIVAGYCVEGTLAKYILDDPQEITAMNGQKLPLNMSVDYISFSAHTDYKQTSGFIRALKPPQVILVHGEANEMSRLKTALIREYENDPTHNIEVHNPRNAQSVELYFRGEKMAKVMGSLAVQGVQEGLKVSGILVKRNFNYHILSPNDLSKYTDLTMSKVTQRQSIHYTGSLQVLHYVLQQTAGEVKIVEVDGDTAKKKTIIRAFGSIDIIHEPRIVTLEWVASPCNDMFADAVLSAVLQVGQWLLSFIVLSINLQAESFDSPKYLPAAGKMDEVHFKECLIELLQDMFGEESVPKILTGDTIKVTVDNKDAIIWLSNMTV